jgi:exosortase/archaeosortase family protein
MNQILKSIITEIKNQKGLRFLVNIALLGILFTFFYYFLRDFKFVNDIYLWGIEQFSYFLLTCSKYLVQTFGYEAVTYGKTIRIIDGFTARGVFLDRGCMGRNVLLAYAGLIIAAPGNFKNKLWFIPMGLAIITFVNIIRISGLAITAHCCTEYLDINHHFVFKISAWIVIFFLWVIWFKKYMNPKKKTNIQK